MEDGSLSFSPRSSWGSPRAPRSSAARIKRDYDSAAEEASTQFSDADFSGDRARQVWPCVQAFENYLQQFPRSPSASWTRSS